jgi:hypothetical protein
MGFSERFLYIIVNGNAWLLGIIILASFIYSVQKIDYSV